MKAIRKSPSLPFIGVVLPFRKRIAAKNPDCLKLFSRLRQIGSQPRSGYFRKPLAVAEPLRIGPRSPVRARDSIIPHTDFLHLTDARSISMRMPPLFADPRRFRRAPSSIGNRIHNREGCSPIRRSRSKLFERLWGA